jgi:predicted nucleic acid-binding protein
LEKSGAGCWKNPKEKNALFWKPGSPVRMDAGRVLPFDEKAALIWARLIADGAAKGRPRSALDIIIAAVAEANGCLVVTDNEKDFTGMKFVNPLRVRRTD